MPFYPDAADDIDQTVLAHAVRIGRYLYPNAYLSAASAILLGPTRDGRLYRTGPRVQRTRIVEEYGGPKAASDAVWALARENEWYREGEGAEKFLLRGASMALVRNEAAFSLNVAWHGLPIGTLAHDGFEWRWSQADGGAPMPPAIRQTTPGRLPPFVVSLLPEGWLESVLHDRDERAMLRSGKRYMSNITIAENKGELAALPLDVLTTRLVDHATAGTFTGTYAGPGRSLMEQDFERNLATIYARADTPRLSGVQIKAPMTLDSDGRLSPGMGTPFTHILKPAGTGGFEALPPRLPGYGASGEAAVFRTLELCRERIASFA